MYPGYAVTPDVLLLLGTRPEGIKLAPLAHALRMDRRIHTSLVDTGQHPGRVAEALAAFALTADVAVRPERSTGSLPEFAAALIATADRLLASRRPSAVVVQGDTLTAFAAGLVAFWHRIPVVHLEAGLRTHDVDRPFPEEANRSMLARIAALHLAPTAAARAHLLAEAVPAERIVVTGNTVVDALAQLLRSGRAQPPRWVDPTRRILVATTHRRENWGAGVAGVCAALRDLCTRRGDLQVVMVTHPNPELSDTVAAHLRGTPVRLAPPLPYPEMIGLLDAASLIITDSGGLQEEAATLGLPMLVSRETTERPEALGGGYGELVGTEPDRIVSAAVRYLATPRPLARTSPYGDGHAAVRAAQAIVGLLGLHQPALALIGRPAGVGAQSVPLLR